MTIYFNNDDTYKEDALNAPVLVNDKPIGFFPFHDYDYFLNVDKQLELMPETKPLAQGLREEYAWFQEHRDGVNRKPMMEYIENHLT